MKNYKPDGFGVHTIKVKLQKKDYKGEIVIKEGGNCKGFSILKDMPWNLIDRHDDPKDKLDLTNITLVNNKGEEYKKDLSADETILEKYIVGVEIINYAPQII